MEIIHIITSHNKFMPVNNIKANPKTRFTKIAEMQKINFLCKEFNIMKNVNTVQGKETMERFKMEAANEVGVNLKNGYNGDLTSREAGSVGGQMVKKMIDAYKQGIKS